MDGFPEHDLNKEIDRLTQASAEQKRTIAELQCKMVAMKFDSVDVSQVSYRFTLYSLQRIIMHLQFKWLFCVFSLG